MVIKLPHPANLPSSIISDSSYGLENQLQLHRRLSVVPAGLASRMAINYLLFESAVGFCIFDVIHQADTVGHDLPEVKKAINALDKFGRMVKLRSFQPWR